MKASVPPTAKIAKDAKECVQECVSEFISFVTSEAAEKCHMEKRKTIGGEDILYAMISLGFENYAETLRVHLAKLRQVGLLSYCHYEYLRELFRARIARIERGRGLMSRCDMISFSGVIKMYPGTQLACSCPFHPS